jgi:hypothetical protein
MHCSARHARSLQGAWHKLKRGPMLRVESQYRTGGGHAVVRIMRLPREADLHVERIRAMCIIMAHRSRLEREVVRVKSVSAMGHVQKTEVFLPEEVCSGATRLY